jgi:restriction system protein
MANILKGWIGEKVTTLAMWAMLDKNVYRRIDNVIINTPNGTTQIDHVLVSVYGIFVIETKNIRGWIFGAADSDKWMQSIFGKKSQFQNPVKQNYRHTKSLAEYLKLDHDLFKPIVFFIGDCQFKTDMPSNVLSSGLIPYIKGFKQALITPQQVAEIEAALISLKQDKSLNRRTHLDSLRERHESTTICPRCGGALVQRVSKTGAFAGKPFLGCSNYPKCKYLKKL